MTDDEEAIRSWWDQARSRRSLFTADFDSGRAAGRRIRLESSLFFLLSFTFDDDLARLIP